MNSSVEGKKSPVMSIYFPTILLLSYFTRCLEKRPMGALAAPTGNRRWNSFHQPLALVWPQLSRKEAPEPGPGNADLWWHSLAYYSSHPHGVLHCGGPLMHVGRQQNPTSELRLLSCSPKQTAAPRPPCSGLAGLLMQRGPHRRWSGFRAIW